MRFHASILVTFATMTLAASVTHAGLQFETPVPTAGSGGRAASHAAVDARAETAPVPGKLPSLAPSLQTSIECFSFDTDSTLNAGQHFIPADASCAAGPSHVMDAGNAIIEWRTKDYLGSAPEFRSSLKSFFSALPAPAPNPGTGTSLGTPGFNPRVIYDQYAGRFLVVVLERWDTASGNASNQSRILLAISKTSDPNDGFWFHAINSKVNVSGVDSWVDFPGVAVDDKAVYITGNMFSFGATSVYEGVRLWIVSKTAAYADNDPFISLIVRNPYASAGAVTTTIPTHMFGTPPTGSGGRPMGTFLLAYSGITDGTYEYLQIVEVTDPLQTAGGPYFTVQQLEVGDIDNPMLALPDAIQGGSAWAIETNDRRMLSAVWRGNKLYCAANIRGAALSPDANQCVARWWRLNTASTIALTQADAGNVTGEDIAAGTHTYYPAVMVDADGNMAVGFSASGPSVYPGAYYATRLSGDPAGVISAPTALALGVDYYRRYFGGTSNRWGNYSGIALSQPDQTDFWIFNQYAGPRGSGPTGENGRWHTRLGRFRIKTVTAVEHSPAHAGLFQNVPNPFNPLTTIRFTLSGRVQVDLSIFDMTGRRVRTLVNDVHPAGDHAVVWDGRDDRGNRVASGIYVYRFRAGGTNQSRKMVLLK
jgi:FlgD Ig-like domain